MPTAARLVAAIVFAALAWVASEEIKPLMPEGMDLGYFSEFNALMGVICGWTVAGSRAGGGYYGALGYGLTATAMTVFWALFFQCAGEMIRKSLRKQYDGAMEAVVGVFELMIKFGQVMIDARVIAILVVGGLIAGLITEFTAKRLP